jgi:hypothetical protein
VTEGNMYQMGRALSNAHRMLSIFGAKG